MCGRDSIETTQLTENNDEVTCGLCWRSMWGSWGVEPPTWVSRNKGGRKLKKAKQEESKSDEKMRCSFCDKPADADGIDYLVAGPAAGIDLPRVYICNECIDVCAKTIDGQRGLWQQKKQLLEAKTGKQVDSAFEIIFDVVNEARKTGATEHVEGLFRWIQTPDAIQTLHTDLLLSALRLTFTMKHHLHPSWPDLLGAIEKELTRRGEDSKMLLWGLMR